MLRRGDLEEGRGRGKGVCDGSDVSDEFLSLKRIVEICVRAKEEEEEDDDNESVPSEKRKVVL